MSIATNYADYGSGKLAPADSIDDPVLAGKLKKYKKTVAKRYRICEPDVIDKRLPEGTLWLSPKVDGQLWFLIKKDGDVAMCAYNGRVLKGVPVVDEAEELLKSVGDVIIAGELFAIPPKGEGRPRVHHVNKALAQGDLDKTLGFKAFDLAEEGDVDLLGEPYGGRLERLNALLEGGRRVSAITTVEGDRTAVSNYYQEWVRSSKFEGIVARSEQGLTYKIKPTLSVDVVVIAFGEAHNNGVAQMRELTVGVMRDDGTFHLIGTVGNGFSDEDRVAWHRRLAAMEVTSSFRLANREGTLCRFVRPEIVIEVKCSDLMDTDSSDLPVRRMVVEYAEGNYATLGVMPIPSMLFPIFLRERDDKKVDIPSIGLDQIYQHLPFTARHETPRLVSLSTAEVIRREVYTKFTKKDETTAVRKFVVIATHKDKEDTRYPPFVAFFTDYSPTRSEPLKTALKVAPTLEDLEIHIKAWLVENVKKGWDLHAG